MKALTRAIIIALGVTILPVLAEPAEYYLHVDLQSANTHISINGFPVTAEVATTLNQHITLFLVNGTNTIEVAYCPNEQSHETSKLMWAVLETPDDGTASIKDAKRIVKSEIGSRVVSLPKLSKEDFTLYRGSLDAQRNFIFHQEGGRIILGGRFSPASAFRRLPSRISYRNLTQTITNAKIRFMRSGTPISVMFAGISLPKGDQTVDLPVSSIASGAQWWMETGFDEIVIEGQLGKTPDKQVMLGNLTIAEIQGVVRETKVFELTLPHWHWQTGERCTKLTEQDTAAIWQLTKAFHAGLQQKNLPVLHELLRDKRTLYQQYLHLSREEMDAIEKKQFAFLTSDPDLKLLPIHPSDIRYILLNPQIVMIRTLDDDCVVRGIPPDPVKGGVTHRFELFFSRIGGKWVIAL